MSTSTEENISQNEEVEQEMSEEEKEAFRK